MTDMAATEVHRYTAADSSEEQQKTSLVFILSAMRLGDPSPRDLVSRRLILPINTACMRTLTCLRPGLVRAGTLVKRCITAISC